MTLSAMCVVESTSKPIAYVAVTEGSTFEVYAGLIDHEMKEITMVLRVQEAQNDSISGL